MARKSATTADNGDTGTDVEIWSPPTSDQEFVYEGPDSLPEWADKNWASYDRGPALAVPAGDVYGTGPYTTNIARVGDKVVFTAATASKPAKFTVIEGEPVGENATKRPAAYTNASLEDMLKTGVLSPDDLGDDAKAQVTARSPGIGKLIAGTVAAPEAVNIGDFVKTA